MGKVHRLPPLPGPKLPPPPDYLDDPETDMWRQFLSRYEIDSVGEQAVLAEAPIVGGRVGLLPRPRLRAVQRMGAVRLTTGHDIGSSKRFPHYDERNFDYTERRWNAVKEEVLSYWAANFPCTRPSAWWRFSALEPRRQSESAYLDRLDLWLPGETELLVRTAKGRAAGHERYHRIGSDRHDSVPCRLVHDNDQLCYPRRVDAHCFAMSA